MFITFSYSYLNYSNTQRHSTGAVLPKTNNATNRHSSSGTTILKIWQCPACTYENSSASVVCEICQSPRGLANAMAMSATEAAAIQSNQHHQSIMHPITDVSRKESKLMENLRKIEESEARTKWENICQYCKEVISLDSMKK